MKIIDCARCKTEFGMSDKIYATALERREEFLFYCPNGHSQSFVTGQSEAEKLRQERDRLVQRMAQKDDEIKYQREQRELAERRVSAAKGQITKIKKRAFQGVCPCCNRQISNLQFHMHAKHPNYVEQPDATATVN